MNILLTSAGRRGYMVDYFRQALKGEGEVHASNSVMSTALARADRFVLTPLIYDERYIDFVIDYCTRNEITAIIPLFDIDLPVLAQAKDQLNEYHIQAVVSNYEVTQICNDKWKTCCFLSQNGIVTPKTFLTLKEAKQALAEDTLRFPVFVKPRWGMGSIGIFVADNLAELECFYYKTLNTVRQTYLKYESQADFERSVIIQEKLLGTEYGLDVVNDLSGRYVTTLVKRKIAMRNGETDAAVTEDSPALRTLGSVISSQLRHVGNLDVDCFRVDDILYVLEMNCRFGGGYPFSHLAGANIPLAVIYWLKGQIAPKQIFEINFGVEGAKDINPIIMRKTQR